MKVKISDTVTLEFDDSILNDVEHCDETLRQMLDNKISETREKLYGDLANLLEEDM